MTKAIWIDLDNSPHVPVFAPIIEYYRRQGIQVVVSARNHAQTVELLNIAGFGETFTVIGRHYGKNRLNKVRGLIERARLLVSFIKETVQNGTQIGVAVSHGSRSMVLAARWLKIPVISMYDYEFTETVIFNRFSNSVVVPDQIPDSTLDEIRLPVSKRKKYSGLKEEIYLKDFEPDEGFWRNFVSQNGLSVDKAQVIVVVRPPATTANYHNETSESVFRQLLIFLLKDSATFTVILPRTAAQRVEVATLIRDLKLSESRCFLIEKAVNGLDLVCSADLLISGGGTMNRESVLLGTPVYSIFAGKLGALDAAMEKDGRLAFIRTPNDIEKIDLKKKARSERVRTAAQIESVLRTEIESYL